MASEDTTLEAAFGLSDDILLKGIQGITQMLGEPGLLDVDFSHVLRLIRTGGGTYISLGYGEGENRAIHAVESALSHPLLEDIQIQQAKGLIVKFNGDLSIAELEHAMHYLQARTSPETEIIPAVNTRERLNGQVMVTLLATGIGATALEYAPVMPEIRTVRVQEEQHIVEESPAPMDFTPHSSKRLKRKLKTWKCPLSSAGDIIRLNGL